MCGGSILSCCTRNTHGHERALKEEEEEEKSKSLLANSTLFVYPTENSKRSIVADASDIAVEAVLQQEVNGMWQPTAFFLRKLAKIQLHYSAFDRELFAAYAAIRHFRHFVDEADK